MTTPPSIARLRQLAGDPRARWIVAVLLLLPPVFYLFPVPIDETRYLAVAWNMHLSGQWLVPWLDSAPYSDKGPLLFWLIDLAWSLTGVHAWTARLLELLFALATLPLLASLGRRLGIAEAGVQATLWLWLGCMAVSLYAGIVMFDMLLTLCTLVAWRATPALGERRWVGGCLLLAAAMAAGTLTKGPVALLVGGMPALLAPGWMPTARPQALYPRLLAALILAVQIALAWAIPAARAGGPDYANAIFLHQTMGRVVHSFAHARPWWWYLPLLPVMLLPWSAAIGRGAHPARAGAAADTPVPTRFAATAFLPGFVVFSLISGKQPHYLLPLLPALALMAGQRLGMGQWRMAGRRVGLVLVIVGVATAVGLGWLAPEARLRTVAIGVLVVALGLPYLRHNVRELPPSTAALGMLAALALCKLAFMLSLAPRYDIQTAATRIAAAQRAATPLLYAGTQYGLFTFAGRLTAPIPESTRATAIAAWARAHPQGWVISGDTNHQYRAAPLYRQAYLDHSLGIWRAADIAAESSGQPGRAPVRSN